MKMAPIRPALVKVAHFESVFPYALESNEWKVKWPIKHNGSRTYNPDYFCHDLNCYIEVATSQTNILTQGPKWIMAIESGYQLRVFWWTGEEITDNDYEDCKGFWLGNRDKIMFARHCR